MLGYVAWNRTKNKFLHSVFCVLHLHLHVLKCIALFSMKININIADSASFSIHLEMVTNNLL